MPEFSRKNLKFAHGGMNWNRPIDAIPDGQVCYARNCRVVQQGSITGRPGLTSYIDLGGTFTHTTTRLNNFDANVNFSRGFIIGQDSNLYFGAAPYTAGTDVQIKAALSNPSQNPLKLPPAGATTTLSGNPLTLVDMAPVGAGVGWKYIGDSTANLSVGYYPGDDPTTDMGRAITMGIRPPVFTSSLTPHATGLLNGDYQWRCAFRNIWTGARSNPSAPSRDTLAAPAVTLTNQYVIFTLPQTPIDPQTGAADANIVVDVYRFGGTIFDWRYVGTDAGGATFQDNLPDASIITASTPPQVTDPITGVTRFNLYRPFVVQDIARFNSAGTPGTANNTGSGTWILTAAGTDTFNLGILPGSAISINNAVFTVFQVRTSKIIEIVEDAAGTLTAASSYPWAIPAGTLVNGSPLAHIWGPYGTGQGGAFVFACGDSSNAGTLYWCNGNDPDSTDLVNSVLVTSPSEPLRGGCVYDGTPFCWSTERMFRIYPGTVAGQFTVQEIPGSKGIWAEYSLTVQSNGISDQSVSWVGKDGIYDWSVSAGLQSLTDIPLYPFFPHDNQAGTSLRFLFPFSEPTDRQANAPDYSTANMKYHRLTWYQGELFYDYVALKSAGVNRYHSLVFDSKEAHGWVSLDQYQNSAGDIATLPVSRGIEIAASNMKVGIGGEILDYTGTSDAGNPILCRLVTRQDDLGDARFQKLFGDYMVDAAAGTSTLTINPLFGVVLTGGTQQTFTDITRTQNSYTTVGTGLGTLNTSFGLDITWTIDASPATLYQYEFAYVPKPEFTGKRATDKTDDGYNGTKYLRGLCIEANTNGAARTVTVLVDDISVGTLTVTAADQLELPFAITPIAGSEFQLQPTDTNHWELFQVRWVWEKWPDLTIIQSPWMDLKTSKPKYIRSFTIPISGPATPTLFFTAVYDGSTAVPTTPVSPASLTAKTSAQFSFIPPILAHQIKLAPNTPIRAFYEEIVWDAEEWPELATLYGPVENLGTASAKYLRGFELPIETNNGSVVMELHYDNQPTPVTGLTLSQPFGAVRTTALSKNVFPYTPLAPVIAHQFQLSSDSPARFFYSEIKWDFEVWPEFDDGSSPWMDAGNPGAKFMQGLVVPLDTGGVSVTFDLVYDGGSLTLGPFNTPAGAKTPVPFSFPVPVIMHEFQLTPRTNCRVWYEGIKWVWEPVPELVTTYSTQATDMDLPGYHYQFDCYIAYIGTGDGPILGITTEYGTITYQLPVSNGVYTRAYILLQPQKAKWRQFHITSTGGLRLFLKDCEVRVKEWTDKGNYPSGFQSHRPFGDDSRESGARI